VEGFTRYSRALAEADVVWDQHSLDLWLADSRAFIPGNRMTFPGFPEEAQRQDLIAFLQSVSEEASSSASEQTESTPGSMMGGGMMRQGQMLNLKELEANNRITSISHCGDTYTVLAETEEAYEFWEFNLRFKTDGSDLGPVAGHPVIIPASMRGDRAFIIFASPVEISPFIQNGC
jgi:cytochrome c